MKLPELKSTMLCILAVAIAIIYIIVSAGCSTSGGAGPVGGYTQDPHFVRPMRDLHIGIQHKLLKRVNVDPEAHVPKMTWNVLYCPRSGTGPLGEYGCQCQGTEDQCVYGWDRTAFGSHASTRLYVGENPRDQVIEHEGAHKLLALLADNPDEILAHPTGHPSTITINGKRWHVKRDIIPSIRWPMVVRGTVHWIRWDKGKDVWEMDKCGYNPHTETEP